MIMETGVMHMFVSIIIYLHCQVLVTSSRIKIEPDAEIITKYVGDSVNLTCFIDRGSEINHEQLPPMDISSIPIYTLNWILPSNGQDRVQIEEEKDRVSVYIKNLKEVDHGNYTCSLLTENKVSSKKSSVYLGILPRGRLSSCTAESFYCEKTLCIPNRYECDGISDCPNGLDEAHHHCGSDPCFGKLVCDDGRCLLPKECCIEPGKSPPNCSIHASIRCCRQLIHPAQLDQDLYYLASRPNVKNVKDEMWYNYTTTTLLVGGFVFLMTFITVGLVIGIHFRLCRPYSSPQSSWHRPPPWNVCSPQRLMNPSHHPTDQYLLQSSNGSLLDRPEYIRRIPGLRSDLLSPNVLRSHSQEDSTLVLVPLTHSGLPVSDCGPPPSYQQVIGAPPPPYSSEGDSLLSQGLEAPLLSTAPHHSHYNNNNGDINGNMTSHHPVAQNRNFTGRGIDTSSDPTGSSAASSFPNGSSSQSSPTLFSTSPHSGPSGYGFFHARK